MALKKREAAPAAADEPAKAAAFEEPEEIKAEETAAKNEVENAPSAAPEPAAAVPVVQASHAVAAPIRKLTGALAELECAIDPTSINWNTFTVLTVSLDGFEDRGGNKSFGKKLVLDVMSWNKRWVASPGVQDAEATELVRYSLDGKTIEGTGESLAAYVATMQVDGYNKASVKEYLTVYGFLIEADNGEIDAADRPIVALQVPPQSRSLFSRYQIETGVKIAQGVIAPSTRLTCTQEKVKGKTATYAQINFSR